MTDMETLVRERMTEETEDLFLLDNAAGSALRAAARHRSRRRRGLLVAALVAACTVAGAGVAAATGVLPWWNRVQSMRTAMSSPFATAADPAAVPGSAVRLSAPGPESTTFEIVTGTVNVATGQASCTAIAVRDAQGRSQRLLTSCGAAGSAVAQAARLDWQSPSGVAYAIFAGPTPTSSAAAVALRAGSRDVVTGRVAGGYYLVWAAATQAADSLVFSDAQGQVVGDLTP
ncbi:MAG: hypothetical protein ABUS54_02805 [Actinomycetota bacterium]